MDEAPLGPDRSGLSPQGPSTRAAGGRTSVSAPLDIQPKTPVPMGRPTTWIGQPPMCAPPSKPSARAQHPGRGGADLCVRSVGHPSANPRPNGQPQNLNRKSHVRATENTLRKGRAPGSRGGGPLCPLRWANNQRHPSQWAAQTPESKIHLKLPSKGISERCQVRHPPKPFQGLWKNVPRGHDLAEWFFSLAHIGLSDPRLWVAHRTILFRSNPSGADTEVRPPATRLPAPFEWFSQSRAHRAFRSRSLSCPSNASLPIQFQRSGHRGPPPRRPVFRPLRRVFPVGRTSEVPTHVFGLPRHDGDPANPPRRSLV
jgi:hypothetical protein